MSRELWGSGGVYRRGKVWWIQYCAKGKMYRKSARTKKRAEAVKLLKKYVGETTNGLAVITPIAERVTLGAMLEALHNDYARKGNRSKFVAREAYLLDHFGKDARAVNLKRDAILAYVAKRRTQLVMRPTGKEIIVKGKTVPERKLQPPSNGTINFELALLRRAFKVQIEAGNLSNGHLRPMPMLEAPAHRQGFLEPAQFEALVEKLPEHVRDAVRFLYKSGWRKNEVLSLEWRDVFSSEIRLRVENSKTKKPRELPLSLVADIIERARTEQKRALRAGLPICPFVFQRDGKKLPSFRKAWASACRASGHSGLIIHDLRRSAVRNLVRAGISERNAMGFTGHETRAIFDNYNIISTNDREADALKLTNYLSEHAHDEQESNVVEVEFPRKGAQSK